MSELSIEEILSELVSYPTFSPDILNSKKFPQNFKVPDSYYKCREFIEKFLKKANFTTENYEFDGFPIILGWYQTEKSKNSPRILLLMHFDVVPIELSWKKGFSMIKIEDPNLGLLVEGRGVADMKGAIAALLKSVKKITDIPDVDICLAFTSDEELGGFKGTNNLVSEIFLKKKNWMPNYVITGDAINEEIVNLRRNAHFIRMTFPRIKKIIEGVKKTLNFNSLIDNGKTSHAAYFRIERDIHALYEASNYFKANKDEYIYSLQDNQFIKSNVIPKKIILDSVLQITKSNAKFEIEESFTEIVRNLSNLITISLPKGQSALGINISPNMISFFDDTFEILIDLRSMLPATEKLKIEKALLSLFSEIKYKPKIDIESLAGPLITAENSFLIQSAKKAWKIVTGKEIITSERAGATDSRYFSYRGIECIDIGPVGYNVHGTRETVVLDSLKRLSAFFPEIVRILSSKEEK